MNTLFYIFIILFIITELFLLSNIFSVTSLLERTKEYSKAKKKAEGDGIIFIETEDYKSDVLKILFVVVFYLLEWFFMFIGLMSKNSWPIFALLAVLPVIFGIIKFKNIILKTIYGSIIKISKICLMSLALLNSYHFHYDIISIFKNIKL